MNNSEVLSVNPCKSTLGELNPEACVRMFRNRVYDRRRTGTPARRRDILGVRTPSGIRRNATLLTMRVAFGALMIAAGCMGLSGHGEMLTLDNVASVVSDNVCSILEIVAGGVLVTGLLTRILSGLAACGFIALAIAGGIAGYFDQTCVMSALVCVTFMLSGPGKISFDRLIAKAIDRRKQRNQPAYGPGYNSYLS